MPKITDKHVQQIQKHLGDFRIKAIRLLDKGILGVQEELIKDIEKDN